jgi:hypothetical protein
LLSTSPYITGSTGSSNGSVATDAWLKGLIGASEACASAVKGPPKTNGDKTINIAKLRAAILLTMLTSPTARACVQGALARFFRFTGRDSSAATAAALKRAAGRGDIREQRAGILTF